VQNISLIAALEGTQHKVTTDWFAIMATLEKREMNQDELQSVYDELCAGLIVTTRGLTLAKINDNESEDSLLKADDSAADILV
jgi:hypothetical protein